MKEVNKQWYGLLNLKAVSKFLGYRGTNSIRIGHLENRPRCRNKKALEELRTLINKWIDKYKI